MAERRPLLRRREYDIALDELERHDVRGVLILGPAASGKTSILRMLADELQRRGRAVFWLDGSGATTPGDLNAAVIAAIEGSPYRQVLPRRLLRRSSARYAPSDLAQILQGAEEADLPRPTVFVDDLGAAVSPQRVAAAIDALSRQLGEWTFVVAARPRDLPSTSLLRRFTPVRVGLIDQEFVARLGEVYGYQATGPELQRLAEAASGNPLVLTALLEGLQRDPDLTLVDMSISSVVERLLESAIAASSDAAGLRRLLELLVVAGGRVDVGALARSAGMSVRSTRALLDEVSVFLSQEQEQAETVVVVHDLVRRVLLSRLILREPFRLADLRFGSEAAERDELLNQSYIRRPALDRVLHDRRSIIIGDRGSGKSALFREARSRLRGSVWPGLD